MKNVRLKNVFEIQITLNRNVFTESKGSWDVELQACTPVLPLLQMNDWQFLQVVDLQVDLALGGVNLEDFCGVVNRFMT